MASTDASLFSYGDFETKKDKSPTALRTISEASEILDVPQHVLRFWETKFTQIKPLKRNGGRRFYRPQDLDVLQQIKHLLYAQGYTIKGAKKAVDDFIHARSAGVAVSSTEWIASLPPANMNDNNLLSELAEAEAVDAFAQLAQALSEPEVVETVAATPAQAFPRQELLALRDQLVQARNDLRIKLQVTDTVQ